MFDNVNLVRIFALVEHLKTLIMYFTTCITLDDAKSLYRKLCHSLHPDKGGKASDFIAMRKEFKNFVPSNKKESDKDFNFDKFEDLVYQFNGLTDIKVSFVGSWIWLEDGVVGATYNQKDKIKAIKLEGFKRVFFNRNKKAWCFSPEGSKSRYSKQTLEEIKGVYGSQSFTTQGQLNLA